MSNVIELPFIELEFDSPEPRAEFEGAAAEMHMTPSEYTFYLFESYRSQEKETVASAVT